jgi:hypothetical protein
VAPLGMVVPSERLNVSSATRLKGTFGRIRGYKREVNGILTHGDGSQSCAFFHEAVHKLQLRQRAFSPPVAFH